MKKPENAPKKKPVERKPDPGPGRGKRPGADRKHSAAPEGSQKPEPDPASSGKPSPEEVISNSRKPVTNQDEQEKITNAAGDDIPTSDQ